MSITSPVYATREQIKRTLDIKETSRDNLLVDSAIEASSRSIEDLTNRRFYPQVATRYFDWPSLQSPRSWRLWLDQYELISVTSITANGIPITNYFLEPINSGPPYNRVEINLGSASAFQVGNTHQRNIAITGLYGYDLSTAVAGVLAGSVTSGATTINVSDSSLIGIGDLIQIESERLLVTDKLMLTTGQTLQTPMTADNANVTVAVTTGSAFHIDEVILLDSERMLIIDIAGNNLTVKRAWDGSVLASHTGPPIYTPRTLTVFRGYLGTTAAGHADLTAISRIIYPSLINELAIAEAINTILQKKSGYARIVGSGDNARESSGKGLKDLRDRVYTSYGRKVRMRVV